VLLVEDDEDVRLTFAAIMEGGGCSVVAAADGASAHECLSKQRFDLVVCDIGLPDISGLDVLERVRADPSLAHVQFVFLTARAERRDIRSGMALGADDYLTKPVEPEELLDAVRARVRRSRQLRVRDAVSWPGAVDMYAFVRWLDGHSGAVESCQGVVVAVVLDRYGDLVAALGAAGEQRLEAAVMERLGPLTAGPLARVAPGQQLLWADFRMTSLMEVVSRVLRAFAEPLRVGSATLQCTVSLGLAVWPEDGAPQELVYRARTAALHAQAENGCTFLRFAASMEEAAAARLRLESALREALHDGSLDLLYQPLVEALTGRVVSVEALARWRHPQRGAIAPSEFVPAARLAGLDQMLEEWSLRTACRDCAAWRRAFACDVGVSINVSAAHLESPGLRRVLEETAQSCEIDPGAVILELLESSVVDEEGGVAAELAEVRAAGFKVAIDDFGTGYSSLSYLHRLPIDEVKIDRSFLAGEDTGGAGDRPVLEGVVDLGHRLGAIVCVEGVETQADLERVQQAGCDLVQGYLFSPALTVSELHEVLQGGGVVAPRV
jgi:EAL domain-containing protein (putative c-di-GMP-specific phosphodiesterase class I)/ActR/RegA family two-component response regulator